MEELKKNFPRIQIQEMSVEKTVDSIDCQEMLGNDLALLQEYIKQSNTDLNHNDLLETGMELLAGEQ